MTESAFNILFGRWPEEDDLERVNCLKAGKIGHHCCGLCSKCGYPRFMFNRNCQHWHDIREEIK